MAETSPKIAIVASEAEPAQRALAELRELYATVEPDAADIIVALGGDGFMLETLHRFLDYAKPIFGMHRGSVGFLMNSYRVEDLPERIASSQPVELHPLEMAATDLVGICQRAIAFNEVSLLRESRQAARDFRDLSRSLKQNPSQLIYEPNYRGVEVSR